MKTPSRSHFLGNSAEASARSFNAYVNAETSRVVESSPPRPLIPFQKIDENESPLLNGPTATNTTMLQPEEKQQHVSSEEDTVALLPESKGVIPLQDLDHEPDMTKEESDTPSEAASEPDVECQEEAATPAAESTEEASDNVQEDPAENGGEDKPGEEEDEGFEHGTPLNYYGDNNIEEELLVPEGCVRVEYQPQPKPPSPVEVSDVDTMSPPPPTPPPPPPEEEEVEEGVRDEGVGQEFPSPPPEILPSPPPELTDEFQK